MDTVLLFYAMDLQAVAKHIQCKGKQPEVGYLKVTKETQDFLAESNRGIAPRSLGILFDELERASLNNPKMQYRIR